MIEPIQVKGYSLVRKANLVAVCNINNREEASFLLAPRESEIGKLNIQLSNICNMSCKYCSEGIYNRDEKKEVCVEDTKAVILAYLEYIASLSLKIGKVRLSFDYGGEPLCQLSKLVEITIFFREQCTIRGVTPLVQITTNGVWFDDSLRFIKSYVDECIVSIDGPVELHEKYRIHPTGKSVFNLIVQNARELNKIGKLYQISSVVTLNTLEHTSDFASFFVDRFPYTTIRIRPVMSLGNAMTNDIKMIPMKAWREFVTEVRQLSGDRLKIVDTKPEKSLHILYQYGCEYLNTASWFFWMDGNISCCTERESTRCRFGSCKSGRININKSMLNQLRIENSVENLTQCEDCLAKYYCAGGCPKIRKQINCETREVKYAELLIKKLEEK